MRKTPAWEETVARALELGWQFGSPRRSSISEWWKRDERGVIHYNGGELWRAEVEGPLWEEHR